MGKPIEKAIDYAIRNGGVLTRSEALALGMSENTLRRRVIEGVLVPLRPGVFALPGASDQHLLDLRAACRKLGAVVSHQSAAFVHDLERPRHIKPTVSVARNTTKDIAGVTVHQLGDLKSSHVVTVDGLAVTTPERTVIDLAAVLDLQRVSRILDHGLAAGAISLPVLSDLFAEVGRRGKPGTALMRRLLEAREGDFIAPESELERRLLLVIADAGLPDPVRQYRAPWLRPVNGRVDLAYPEHHLVIEADSRRWHLLQAAFETDRLRDNAAQLAGWRILRFTWREVAENPERVAVTIRRALEDERI